MLIHIYEVCQQMLLVRHCFSKLLAGKTCGGCLKTWRKVEVQLGLVGSFPLAAGPDDIGLWYYLHQHPHASLAEVVEWNTSTSSLCPVLSSSPQCSVRMCLVQILPVVLKSTNSDSEKAPDWFVLIIRDLRIVFQLRPVPLCKNLLLGENCFSAVVRAGGCC